MYSHSVFLAKYDRKFTKKPKLEESRYRSIPEGMDLNRIPCLKRRGKSMEITLQTIREESIKFFQSRQDSVLPKHGGT